MPCSPKPPAPSLRCPLCEAYEYENHPAVVRSTVVIQHDEIHPLKAFPNFFMQGLDSASWWSFPLDKTVYYHLSYLRAIYNTFLWRNNLLWIGNSCSLLKGKIPCWEQSNYSGKQNDKSSPAVSGWATTSTSKVWTATENNLREAN